MSLPPLFPKDVRETIPQAIAEDAEEVRTRTAWELDTCR